MNIYDIAHAAGVSIATVSRVLNNGVVGNKTREKVLRVMEEMGYTPNAFARGLGLGTMNTVGVIVSNIYDLYFVRAVSVLEEKLRHQGYDLILCCSSGDGAERAKSLHLLAAKKVDALILVGSRFAEGEALSAISQMARKLPIFCIGGQIDLPGVYSVLCDDRDGVKSAVTTLYSKGHRDFLYLYDSTSPSGHNKRKGFLDGLALCGLNGDSKRTVRCSRDITEAKSAVKRVFESGLPVSAILTSEDELAVGALQYGMEKGFSIPGTLAVVGYNNSTLSRATIPQLSSIDNKVDMLSSLAVELLTKVFAGQSPSSKIRIAAELVERQTT